MKHSNIFYGKIGTHSSTRLIAWDGRLIKPGNRILAMETQQFDELHYSYRRLKSCSLWKRLYVDSINEDGFVFLSK